MLASCTFIGELMPTRKIWQAHEIIFTHRRLSQGTYTLSFIMTLNVLTLYTNYHKGVHYTYLTVLSLKIAVGD